MLIDLTENQVKRILQSLCETIQWNENAIEELNTQLDRANDHNLALRNQVEQLVKGPQQ